MTVVISKNPDLNEEAGNYQGVPLVAPELQVMLDLEKILSRPIPVTTVTHWHTFGWEAHKGHVIKLSIHNMGLTQLPDSIDKLEYLQELHVGHNKLTQLPESIGNLRHLRTLAVDHNELSAIPDNLGQLHALHTLDLSSNQLRTLPIAFYTMKSLRMVDLGGNPNLRIPLLIERWLVGLRQIGGTIFR